MNYLKKFEQSRRDYERHLANPTPPPVVRPPSVVRGLEVLRVANAVERAVAGVSLNFHATLLRQSIKLEASRQFDLIKTGRVAGHHVRGGKWVRR